MARKSWGPGNPLWEWKRKHGKIKGHARKKRRGGGRMGKKRKGHKSNQLMRVVKRGMFPLAAGITGVLLTGALIGYAQKKGMVPNLGFGVIPAEYEPHIAPLVAGGIPGVLVAAVVRGGIGEGSSQAGAAQGY